MPTAENLATSSTMAGTTQAASSSTAGRVNPNSAPVKSPWLDAMNDPVAGMKCYSSFMTLCDLHADGNHRLILIDLQKRIRIYKGLTIQWEQKLMDVPVGLACFHHDTASSKEASKSGAQIPTLAVASGHQIFVYRYLRPHLKYSLPKMEIHAQEIAVWSSIRPEAQNVQNAVDSLNQLRDQGVYLK